MDFIADLETEHRPFSSSVKVYVSDVLLHYLKHKVPLIKSKNLVKHYMVHLNDFWGDKTIAEIKGTTCREYVRQRTTSTIARRELETLRSAINYFHAEFGLDYIPKMTLPPNPQARTNYLTRDQAAKLLWVCRRKTPHLARFILIGLYTGSRSNAIIPLRWSANNAHAWVDTGPWIIHRKGLSEVETNKRRPPVKLARRLRAHMKRWHRIDTERGIDNVIHKSGSTVKSVWHLFRDAADEAGLPKKPAITPHTLRHTAATWMMQSSMKSWDVAGILGMTVEMLNKTYGHHDPDFQDSIEDAF